MNFPLQAPRMRAAARRVKAGGERFLGGVLPGATARRLQVAAFADEWAASNLDARQANGPLWIVLGDSISQGIGATTRETGYVGVVHDYLRRRDAWRVINLSRAEAGVLDVLARQLPELNAIAATEEIALVTCLIGAEDMARRTPGLDTALRQVISALPTGSVIGLLPHGPRAAGALNSVIREEAERHAMRIAVLPPRLPGQLRGRDNRGLGDVGHAAWARAVLSAADGPVAVAAPATDPRLPIVPPIEDHSPPTDPALPVVPPLDADPAGRTEPGLSPDPAAAEQAFPEEPASAEEADDAVAVADDEPVPAVADAEPLVEEPAADEVAPAEPAAEADIAAGSAARVSTATDESTPEEHPVEAPLDDVAVAEPVADAAHEEPVAAPLDEVVAEEAVVAEPTADDEVVDEPVPAEVSGVGAQPAPSLDEVVIENAALDEPSAEDPVTSGADEEPVAAPLDEVVAEEAVIEEPAAEVEGTEGVDEAAGREPSAADTASRAVASEDESTGSPADEVVADSPADEPAGAEPAAGARDEVTSEEPAVEETPGAASAVETPGAGEAGRSYTGTSSSYGSSHGSAGPDPAGSGVGWAEQFGTAEASNGWAARSGSADPEPVAEVEPVADDEPLEVEVDLFGDTVADPADDPGRDTAYDSDWAEPTAVESPATDEAGDTDRIAARASDVDLFAPTPPTDAPRAYGNGDRGPNDSGADREPGYAERADRR